MNDCRLCRGKALVFIGQEGDLDWFKCRNCGWLQCRTASLPETETGETDGTD